MAETIKLNDNTWRFEDQGVRFFLLTGTEKALLIDTGMTCPNAKELASELTDLPMELLLTHADPDHTSGADAWTKAYIQPAEKANLRMHGSNLEIEAVTAGTVLDLGNRPLEIIELPGHTPGSIAILDVANRVLISGDVIQDGNIFMFGPQRNLADYITSLEKLNNDQTLMARFDEIYPSHGTIPVTKEIIPQLIDSAKTIAAGEAQAIPVELFGNTVNLYKFQCAGFLMA